MITTLDYKVEVLEDDCLFPFFLDAVPGCSRSREGWELGSALLMLMSAFASHDDFQ